METARTGWDRKRWLGVAIGLLAATAIPWFTLTSGSADVAERPVPDARQVEAGREAFRLIREARGQPQPAPLLLTARHVDGAAALLSQYLYPARVTATLEGNEIRFAASRPAPMGRWLNVAASSTGSADGFPAVDLKVGAWRFPQFLSHLLAKAGWGIIRTRVDGLPPLDEAVSHVAISNAQATAMVFIPKGQMILDEIVAVSGDQTDAHAIGRIYCRLAKQQRAAPSDDFAAQIRRAFAHDEPDLARTEQNRATFVALAMFAVDQRAGNLIPGAVQAASKCLISPPELRLGNRTDLPRHWALSAALSAIVGAEVATAIGEWKELADSMPNGIGFSFVDLAADRSGFKAAQAGNDPERAAKVSATLRTATQARLLPPELLEGVEGLTESQFRADYRSTDSAVFNAAIARIDRRLEQGALY